ncbi:hypothetical protein BDR06DRAFT_313959 [Suillus hirtellus]|nr:hypothetical protein BDR06DRAFT_313959 [Suillus hirtellus]
MCFDLKNVMLELLLLDHFCDFVGPKPTDIKVRVVIPRQHSTLIVIILFLEVQGKT